MKPLFRATRHNMQQLTASVLLLVLLLARGGFAADPDPEFFRGINLNGPAVMIDGQEWVGSDSKLYVCSDKAFENQQVKLVPETDDGRARMIRSSRWGGNRIELTDIPAGRYSLFLYVWEDNNSETYSVAVNGVQVLTGYQSGITGHWEKLGPWEVSPSDKRIIITSRGGAANFSGLELWKGSYDGLSQPISTDDLAFFEKRIRPLLINRCYECHSAEAKELQGELLVDSRATLRRGGVTGPAVVPGDPQKSLLMEAVRYENADMQMPPDEQLSEIEIADLEHWVSIGAPDPRSTITKHTGKQINIAEARKFWSLTPLVAPAVPKTDSAWPRTDIDHFVLARLNEHQLQPSAQADRRTLLRRVTYDLTGLPPTLDEIADFLADSSANAFENVVDRLLASPRYGERWGRHWLDVVRYADTAGDNSDYPIPQMHRYRDWVIDAFNRDLPFDEFVRDQLAGDLRGGSTEAERQQRIIATGYLANSRRFGSRVDDYPWHLTIEDTIDNLGKCFLGLSLSCARCHDHKFDPFTTRDYYGLYGIFSSTKYPWPGIELDKRQRDFVPLVAPDQLKAMTEAQEKQGKQQEKLDKDVKRLKDAVKTAKGDEKSSLENELKAAERKAADHRRQPAVFETAYAVSDAGAKADAAVQIKGDPAKTGDIIRRHFPAVLAGGELPDSVTESGRRELAEWIVSKDNPLTARVLANRIWAHHFGTGIVSTANDFGQQGRRPTHPELLDHLAVQLRDHGWSIKALHRRILLSAVYQQSGMAASGAETDPSNQWLSRFPRRRLDAEAIRDTLLAVGGNLDLSPAGAHPFPDQNTWDFTQHKPFKAVYETDHRTVFLMTPRIQRHPFQAVFDGADPSTSTGVRMTTTTPLQALYLLNDPFVNAQSVLVADRILKHADDHQARLQFVFELLLGRPAADDEAVAATDFLHSAEQLLTPSRESSSDHTSAAWAALVRSLFRLNEFVYID
ncbi:MAG: DUF1549 domain-containing protein [Planctomycetaceae bacterium]